jgi:SAM-dependent methyltransferase
MDPDSAPPPARGHAAGPPPLAVRAFRRFSDLVFDWVHGTDTADPVEPGTLPVVGPNADRAIRYQVTRPAAFRRLLREMSLPPGETFVDIGCGKGLVLLLAGEFGFRRIVGVEHAPGLCDIARRNIEAAGGPDRSRYVVHCRDAADYEFPEEETVIYLFNPFDAVVLGHVMQRLGASLARNPRRAWLIYLFPRWHEVIEAQGAFAFDRRVLHGDSEFAVYRHVPPGGLT